MPIGPTELGNWANKQEEINADIELRDLGSNQDEIIADTEFENNIQASIMSRVFDPQPSGTYEDLLFLISEKQELLSPVLSSFFERIMNDNDEFDREVEQIKNFMRLAEFNESTIETPTMIVFHTKNNEIPENLVEITNIAIPLASSLYKEANDLLHEDNCHMINLEDLPELTDEEKKLAYQISRRIVSGHAIPKKEAESLLKGFIFKEKYKDELYLTYPFPTVFTNIWKCFSDLLEKNRSDARNKASTSRYVPGYGGSMTAYSHPEPSGTRHYTDVQEFAKFTKKNYSKSFKKYSKLLKRFGVTKKQMNEKANGYIKSIRPKDYFVSD